MKAGERTLQQLLHSGDQYVIPVFQRYYTWKLDDWSRLWDDIAALLEPEEAKRRHFLGSIVFVAEHHQPGSVPAYQVIDGQQRLTTLSILLCAIRDLAKQAGAEELAGEVNESYLVHKFKKDREHYKLFLRLRDRATYMSLVDSGAPADGSQIDKAYKYFLKAIKDSGHDKDEQSLRTVFSTVSTRLDLVAITLDGENPYKIFTSLNSTGVDLEQGDLIRNHVFMALPIEDQDRFDDQHWRPLEAHFAENHELVGWRFTSFFRDVLLRQGRYIGKNAAYEAFEAAHPLASIDPVKLLPELSRMAKLYDIIEGRKAHASSQVDGALGFIRALNVSTSYPLLLQLLSAHEDGALSEASLVRCLQMVSGFVLRRYVCSESSRAYSRWFCVVCKELGADIEGNLRQFLQGKGWPDDNRFEQAFVKMDLYQSKYGRAVLDGLELSLQRASERVALDKCSVEHVMPQTIEDDADGEDWMEMLGEDWRAVHASWLHTPGNLTLVGHDYNSSMSNRVFATKKPVLAASKVYLNKHFASEDLVKWTADEILARAQVLAKRASTLWPGPMLTSSIT